LVIPPCSALIWGVYIFIVYFVCVIVLRVQPFVGALSWAVNRENQFDDIKIPAVTPKKKYVHKFTMCSLYMR